MASMRARFLEAVSLPETPVSRVAVGVHMTAVESETVGCAFTLREPRPVPHQCREVPGAGDFVGRPVAELARLLGEEAFLARGVGMAAVNSVVNTAENPARRGDVLLWMRERFAGARVGMIGHFPFAPEVREWAGTFHVVEKNPVEDDLTWEGGGAEYLRTCDALIVTGVTLLNDTLPEVIEAAPRAFKLLFGPTVPLHAWLLEQGLDALFSLLPTDADAYFRSIAEGAIVPRFAGTEAAVLGREPLDIPPGDFRPRLSEILGLPPPSPGC